MIEATLSLTTCIRLYQDSVRDLDRILHRLNTTDARRLLKQAALTPVFAIER